MENFDRAVMGEWREVGKGSGVVGKYGVTQNGAMLATWARLCIIFRVEGRGGRGEGRGMGVTSLCQFGAQEACTLPHQSDSSEPTRLVCDP